MKSFNFLKQDSGEKQNHYHEEKKGTELLDQRIEVNKGSLKEDQKTQVDHVPIVPSLVFHGVQSPCYVAVAVVAANVVHALSVYPIGFLNRLVPLSRSAGKIANVHPKIPSRFAKGHSWQGARAVRAHVIRALEIVRMAPAIGNSHVPDEGEYCRDRVKRRPQHSK
mmetsp:Transcript_24962/g.54738  ORF Transcript_24962/g.54738 Transcript_24962/m.54738 type:complete len:166 (+) Transcript_24962:496-993(+)